MEAKVDSEVDRHVAHALKQDMSKLVCRDFNGLKQFHCKKCDA